MSKQILIVDDDRELSRMLHATLELFDRTYKIVEVPSAEEAMLEARRTAFDLIISDIRLPGLDGLEMVRRLQKQRPGTKVVIISAQADLVKPENLQDLILEGYFTKPLSTEQLIATVQKVLGAQDRPAPRHEDVLTYSPSVADRLSALRRDLGCLAVYLGDKNANVVARAGDVSAFDVNALLNYVEVAFGASLKICSLLGGLVSQNLHFFDGDEYDVYVLNVGTTYMLVMLFPGDIGARQMGQVSRYGRLAADDMLNALAESAPEPAMVSPFAQAEPTPKPKTAPLVVPTLEITSPDLPEPIVLTPASDLVMAPQPEPEPVQAIDINFDTLGQAAPAVADADLDSFWDEALTQAEKPNDGRSNELSFEQALKLGLVPKDEPKN